MNVREIFRSNKAAIEAWLEGKPIQMMVYGTHGPWEDTTCPGGPNFTRVCYRPAQSKPRETWEIRRRSSIGLYGHESQNSAQCALDLNFDKSDYCVVHVREVIK